MERPRRKERFARLIQRRGRAFRRTYGPRRLRRQSQPDLVATQGDNGRNQIMDVYLGRIAVTVARAIDRLF
jgi:hypothetical protein